MAFRYTILDFYDDNGSLLKNTCTGTDQIPEFVKTAHVMTGKEDSDLYALVVQDGNDTYKKYPIIDAGNTWLSSLYFAKNMEKLSHDAKVVTATNLKEACIAFDVPIVSIIEKYAQESIPTNFVTDTTPEPIYAEPEEIADYAITSSGRQRYPLHNVEAVSTADQYFTTHHQRFAGSDRREYAIKVAQVADRFGLPVGVEIQSYSTDADWNVVGDHLATRYSVLQKLEAPPEVRQGFVKIAQAFETLGRDKSAELLEQFDIQSGLSQFWGDLIYDPYRTMFNLEKTAMGLSREKATIQVGNDFVTEDALINLSKNPTKVKEQFGEVFSAEFSKEPVKVFQSMPLPNKKMIARLAEDSVGAY